MTAPYVHRRVKKEVTQLLADINIQKRKLKSSPRSKPLREAMITGYRARLGELVEMGLIAFL